MAVIALDLDGVLFDARVPGGIDYADPDSVRAGAVPNRGAVELVQRLAAAGVGVVYVTSRPEQCRAVTIVQLNLARLPPSRLWTPPKWVGATLSAWLAEALEEARADLYVGANEWGAEAARMAEIPLVPADAFRAGHGIEILEGLAPGSVV